MDAQPLPRPPGGQPRPGTKPGIKPGTRIAKWGILGVMAFLLAAAAYMSVLIMERQTALRKVSRYNLTWLVSQGALETARMHGTIGAALVPGSGVDEDDVELRLDILVNRVHVFEQGEVVAFIASSPEVAAIVRRFRETVAAARAEWDRPPSPERLPQLLKMFGALNPLMAQFAAASNTHGGDLVAADQQQLSELHWTFAALLGAITLCGFGLVGAASWHNRRLAQAQEEVRRRNRALQVRDRELNTQNARFDAALNNMSHALCMMDAEGRLIVCNVRFLELFGTPAAQAVPGTPAQEVFAAIADSGRFERGMVSAMAARQLRQARARMSCAFVEQDGSRALAVSQEPMAGGGWVATFEDITERKRAEERISFLAHHDVLTGLPNRVLFQARLDDALGRHAATGENVAILCLDLDQFKQVNDTLGHPAGDGLLKEVATRLLGCVRDGDLVVRLGGDEFAILQAGAKQPASAEALAARVVEELARPHDIDGHRVVVGTSVGIAVASADDSSELGRADTLLKSADIALYCAKAEGRGTFRFFEPSMDAQVQARRAIEADLREALARGELEVFYQPLHNVAAGRICGFEALLRWRHPVRGMISPGTFIPLAEELGLIVPIGEWVLARACEDAASWPETLKVAVNLSPVQFRSRGLVAAVRRALAASGLPPYRLELEITESALLQDSQTVLAMLHDLGALGLRIALDDFGTGYSSLSYLRSFPFDKLKVDQSFIRDIASRPDCEAIVRSVTELAHTLGMTTTAEGVETEEQYERLCKLGCTEIQGFLFDRPRPLEELGRWFPARTRPADATPVPPAQAA